ncbi:MAG: hypothetical protein WDW38_006451 [Sanguina aurantia]
MTSDGVLTGVFEMMVGRLAAVESAVADIRLGLQQQDNILPSYSHVVGSMHDVPGFTFVSKNYQGHLAGGLIYAVVDCCRGVCSSSESPACPLCPFPRLSGGDLGVELVRAGVIGPVHMNTGTVRGAEVRSPLTCSEAGLDVRNHKYLIDEMTESALLRRFPGLVAVGDGERGLIYDLGRGRRHTIRDALRFLSSMDTALFGGERWTSVDLYSLGHEGRDSDLAKVVKGYVCDSPGEYEMLDAVWGGLQGPTRHCVLSQLRFFNLSHIAELLDPLPSPGLGMEGLEIAPGQAMAVALDGGV